MHRRSARDKGFAIIMTALLLLVLVPAVGLAIDVSVLYSIKARLSTASDAAAIAAARSLSVGLTLAEQESAAIGRARKFFEANFPDRGWFTRNHTVTVAVAENGYRTRTVTVNSRVDAPTFFMRVFGHTYLPVSAEGRASRRDINLVLVLDRSGSMAGTPCTQMKSAATAFVDMFAEGRDRLAMIAFSTAIHTSFPPSMNFKTGSNSLAVKINNLVCSGATSTAMALWDAYQKLLTINEPGALNMILLFTDGYPTSITIDAPVKMKSDVRYGYSGGYRQYNSSSRQYDGSTVCNSTSSTCTMEPSPCQDAQGDLFDRNSGASQRQYSAPSWNPNWTPTAKRGVFVFAASPNYYALTGSTGGLLQYTTTTMSSTTEVLITGIAGCAMNNGYGSGRRDAAYLPSTDIYGNGLDRSYHPVTKFASGHAYQSQMRPDVPKAITDASFNAADHSAQRIRGDDAYDPYIYVIGLGDVDHDFNRRVANDPLSSIYDSTRQEGMYVYAPTPAELNYAFVRIASEILRIAR
jgi:Flp pilus assembly protein TadG